MSWGSGCTAELSVRPHCEEGTLDRQDTEPQLAGTAWGAAPHSTSFLGALTLLSLVTRAQHSSAVWGQRAGGRRLQGCLGSGDCPGGCHAAVFSSRGVLSADKQVQRRN